MPSPALKVDKYFDLQCSICARNRSSDFDFGLETNIKRLRKRAKHEGWKFDIKTGRNICPACTGDKHGNK